MMTDQKPFSRKNVNWKKSIQNQEKKILNSKHKKQMKKFSMIYEILKKKIKISLNKINLLFKNSLMSRQEKCHMKFYQQKSINMKDYFNRKNPSNKYPLNIINKNK